MQEKNTNNRLKAEPIAYECDLFSSLAPLGGVCCTGTHPQKRMVPFTSVNYECWRKELEL